jgi:tetratricopeptide (TPR) repeat protein
MNTMSVEGLVARSIALRSAGRHDDALAVTEKALALDPNDYDAMGERAAVLHMLDRDLEALEAIGRCCGMRPDDEWAHRLRSGILRCLGRHGEAVRAAQLAVSINVNEPLSHNSLSQALIGADREIEALVSAHEAVRLGPEMGSTHEMQGNVFLANANFQQAERSFRKALELEPERNVAKYNLTIVLRQLHRADEAIPLARSLILDDPTDTTNVRAMIQSGHDFVRRGPINRAMIRCMRFAAFRVPIVVAAILFPFAMIERVVRRRKLSPGTWEAIQAARKSPSVKAAIRKERLPDLKVYGIIAVILLLVLFLSVALR